MMLIRIVITFLVLWPIYFLSKLVPKKRALWCFSSYRDSFVDNSKYLFHYVHHQYPEIDVIWVTDNMSLYRELSESGYRVVKRKSLIGMLTVLRARYVFCSSYVSELSVWLTGGAKLVNLWHGLPLKKIEFDIDSGALANKYTKKLNSQQMYLRCLYPAAYRRPDFVTAPSEKMADIFKSAFRVEDDNIISASSPRTDQFFDTKAFSSLSSDNLPSTSGARVYVYMPTFRDTGGEFFSKENFDFSALEALMERINGEFWIKAHPSAGAEGIDVNSYSRITLLPNNIDMYPVLRDSYALITDYSSIYIDYLMLNKPIYFYCFDLNDYLVNCRSMYFEYNDVTPGAKSTTFEDLLQSIGSGSDEYLAERKEAIRFFWGNDYKSSCEKIINKLIKEE